MKKIAIFFESTGGGNYGAQNATIERIKHLKALGQYDIDVYMLQQYPRLLPRLLKRVNKIDRPRLVVVDGITINILWYDFFLIDYLLEFKLGVLPLFRTLRFKKLARVFQQYDLISAHMLHCGEIAQKVKSQLGIPYTVTWHGSDIHSDPWRVKNIFNRTKRVIEEANMNLFVSQALLDKSTAITNDAKKRVLYNGVDKTKFYPYPEERKHLVQSRYGIQPSCYHIAFVGHLVPIKNVLSLPTIFQLIKDKIPNVEYHVVGDGQLLEQLQCLCRLQNIPVHFHGRLDKDEMADFYNAIDLMVLPSYNEGLPLVVVEAKACGVEVIASRVGGIVEVIGTRNTVVLDKDFSKNMAEKCWERYQSSTTNSLDKRFDWTEIALLESTTYQEILGRRI